MFTYRQTLRRLKEGEHKDLFDKLSMEDYDTIFTHKTLGLFSQIKEQLIKADKVYVDIPKIGRLEIKPKSIKKKISHLINTYRKIEKDLAKPNLLKSEIQEFNQELVDVKEELVIWTKRLVDRYELFDIEDTMTKNTKMIDIMKKREELYIDPIKKDLVIRLLAEPNLTADGFVYGLKQINSPITKTWFLVGWQNINDIIRKKRGTDDIKISKADLKAQLKEAGIYVESF